MNDLTDVNKPMLRVFYIWTALCLLVWVLFAEYRTYAAGLILGSAVSLINAQYLIHKIQQMTAMILANEKRRFNLGFVTRICIVLIAVMMAVRLDPFNLVSTLAGFFFCPLAALIIAIVKTAKYNASK